MRRLEAAAGKFWATLDCSFGWRFHDGRRDDSFFHFCAGAHIIQRIGDSRYQLWFALRTRFRLNGDVLTVGVPNLYAQEYLQKNSAGRFLPPRPKWREEPSTSSFPSTRGCLQEARAEQVAAAILPAAGIAGLQVQQCLPPPTLPLRPETGDWATPHQNDATPDLPESPMPAPRMFLGGAGAV